MPYLSRLNPPASLLGLIDPAAGEVVLPFVLKLGTAAFLWMGGSAGLAAGGCLPVFGRFAFNGGSCCFLCLVSPVLGTRATCGCGFGGGRGTLAKAAAAR